MAIVRNTLTGKVVEVPDRYLTHPILGANLVPAKAGDKDYVPDLYKSKSAEEFKEVKGEPRAPKTAKTKDPAPANAGTEDSVE